MKSLEFGSLGPGRGAPFVVPLGLGILAVTALMLLVVDPPDVGDWLMVGLVAAICLPIAAFTLAGRHVLVDAGAGRLVLTYSFGPLRRRRRRALAEFQSVSARFRPVTARTWLVRATPAAADQAREMFLVVLEGDAPLLVERCGHRVSERPASGGVAREIRQDAAAAWALD